MNIAVFWPNWIGDAVMATPAVRALRQHFASAHFIGVLKPYIGGILEGSSWMTGCCSLTAAGPGNSAGLGWRGSCAGNKSIWRSSFPIPFERHSSPGLEAAKAGSVTAEL